VYLKERTDLVVKLDIQDLNYKKEFNNLDDVLLSNDPQLKLLSSVFHHFKPKRGFEIITSSQSPVGGGLGGSSSLYISLIRAFGLWLSCEMNTDDLVTLASNLESKVLRTPTGTQDYYGAAKSGLNVIHYLPEGPKHEFIPCDAQRLKSSLFLVNTGKSHHSGINNWQVYKAVIDGDKNTLLALAGIRDVTLDMYSALKEGQWSVLPLLFKKEFQYRVKLSHSFASPEIYKISELMEKHSAEAVKICGAGGGGCVLVWSDPFKKADLMKLCRNNNYEVFDVSPVLDSDYYGSNSE